MKRVLAIGGRGRIGAKIARDLRERCQQLGLEVEIEATGRSSLDLSDTDALSCAIAKVDLVIHTAGPFASRDDRVLRACIANRAHYLDVSDSRLFTEAMLVHRDSAREAGIVAIVNTGVFPGLSNSLVKACVEHLRSLVESETGDKLGELDEIDEIALSYAVGGSGGAGITVMRTTFLALQRPFSAMLGGQWQTVAPYSDREVVDFPGFGAIGTYWFDVPETLTLARHFKARTVTTKFGSAPDFYNLLTAAVARFCPAPLLQNPAAIEFLSRVSYAMTQVTDRWSGVGVAMRARTVAGDRAVESTLCHNDTARAAGIGGGSVAAAILAEDIATPGLWTVEEIVPTALFDRVAREDGFTWTPPHEKLNDER